MRLTVGPLPAAVYWRRRAFVLGGLLLTVFVLMYSCSGGAKSAGPGTAASGAATPSASSSLLRPTIDGSDEPESASAAASAAGSASAEPSPGSVACSDADLSVVAAADATSIAQGAYVKFTLKIKNVSSRTCTRDAGADAQELYLQDAASTKMWTSDACDAPHGTDVRAFPPAIEYAYFVWWNGRTSSTGCTNRPLPAKGTYLLVGRLATKFSEPVQIHVI